MGGKNVLKEMEFEVSSTKMKENQHFVKIFSSSKKDESPRVIGEDEILYCGVDNNRCDGTCRKVNTDKHGCLCCSEVITSKFLPKKRKHRRRFKRREREESF